MSWHGEGKYAVFPRVPFRVKTISLRLTTVKLKAVFSRPCLDIGCYFLESRTRLRCRHDQARFVGELDSSVASSTMREWKSAAVTMYDTGPRPEPWITLAFISATDETRAAYRVEWRQSLKKSPFMYIIYASLFLQKQAVKNKQTRKKQAKINT